MPSKAATSSAGREDVPVLAERPAEQGQIIHHALGDEAVVAVLEQIRLRVPLGELAIALAGDERQVPELGNGRGPPDVDQRLVQRDLARGGRQQVLATQHVRDPHQRVVDRD